MQAARRHVGAGDFADAVFGGRTAKCSFPFVVALRRGRSFKQRSGLRGNVDVQRKPGWNNTVTSARAKSRGRKRGVRFHLAANFLTSTFEFLPLWSYFSRRGAGKSSGVPSVNPALDWK